MRNAEPRRGPDFATFPRGAERGPEQSRTATFLPTEDAMNTPHDPPLQSHESTGETVRPPAHPPGHDPEGKAPQVAGGVVGAGAGLAMGVVGGPIGMVIGALAGAVGGWWATDRITEEMGTYTEDEDRRYREHYEAPDFRLADRSFEDVRAAYAFGHIAASNPALSGRSFAEVEGHLGRDWNAGLRERHGDWATASRYAQVAFERSQSRR